MKPWEWWAGHMRVRCRKALLKAPITICHDALRRLSKQFVEGVNIGDLNRIVSSDKLLRLKVSCAYFIVKYREGKILCLSEIPILHLETR